MPLFDPTFYDYEQQDIPKIEKPIDKRTFVLGPWHYIITVVIIAVVFIVFVFTGVTK